MTDIILSIGGTARNRIMQKCGFANAGVELSVARAGRTNIAIEVAGREGLYAALVCLETLTRGLRAQLEKVTP